MTSAARSVPLKVGNRTGGCRGRRLGVGHLLRQPVHFRLEHVQRHGPGVVGGQQLLAFVVQTGDALLGSVGVAFGLLAVGGKFVDDAGTD